MWQRRTDDFHHPLGHAMPIRQFHGHDALAAVHTLALDTEMLTAQFQSMLTNRAVHRHNIRSQRRS
ncbi:MAG: hypothetical protein JNK37_05590 [Verrucomicrobiales bacterium]|nr:hypothetical protein [Verrucomicrobiales bacterium]